MVLNIPMCYAPIAVAAMGVTPSDYLGTTSGPVWRIATKGAPSMPIPFAHSRGLPDQDSFRAYLEAVAPAVLMEDLPSWAADPTDVICFADMARSTGYTEHARVFYFHALNALEQKPAAIADDTNLSGAYYFYGKTLLELQRAAEAVRPLETAAEMDPYDAVTWFVLGAAHVLSNQFDDALPCLEIALSLEGVDEHQDSGFYRMVREQISALQKERTLK